MPFKMYILIKELNIMKAMQIRAVIIAIGEVQRVGYRDVVEHLARKMKLVGFVENIKPYDVKIVCEGYKEAIDSFVKQLRIKNYPIIVEKLDVILNDATGEFNYFEIKRGDMTEELGERLDIANSKMTERVQKQDLMIETLKYFKYENNENLNRLTNIMAKHDVRNELSILQ